MCAITIGCMALTGAYAGVLSEDVAYWYLELGAPSTVFNPGTEWLDEWIPTGDVLLKVQQTVYDEEYCNGLLDRNWPGEGDVDYEGYLYAYSVTNINWGDPATSNGVVRFMVDWMVTPQLVTTSRVQTPDGWAVDGSIDDPTWIWTDANEPGLLPGQTVGGFWAVGPVGPDTIVDGWAELENPPSPEMIWGKTTGPVAEPMSLAVLLGGTAALGLRRIRLRK